MRGPWLVALAALFATSTAQAVPLDARDLESFFAGAVGALMASYHVPGVAVVVVQGDAVAFEAGYGLADVESGRRVDPEATPFHVASLTKSFTATAAMQLVERGQLDLDADVATYVGDLPLSPRFAEPITLRHLLLHTEGLENVHVPSEPFGTPPTPLGTLLARLRPLRIRPPGELILYGPYGYGLVGLVIERVTGQTFGDYVSDHVLAPLGMTRSGFPVDREPPDVAVGYSRRNGRLLAAVYGRLPTGSGDLYASALDMSRFMRAHLMNGRVPGGSVRILGEESAELMHAQGFTDHPELPGWCLGFQERRYGRVRAIGQDGGMQGVGADMLLVPDEGIGLFVATNLDFEPNILEPLVRAFLARYVPASAADPTPAAWAPSRDDTRGVAGRYVSDHYTRSNLQKLALLSESLDVGVDTDGALAIAGHIPGFDPIYAIPAARDLWRDTNDWHRVAALRGANGAVEHLVVDAWAFDHVHLATDPKLHARLFGASAIVFALTLAGVGLGGLARRAGGRWPPSRVPRVARLLAAGAAATALATLAALARAFATLSPIGRTDAAPAWLRLAQVLPILTAACGVGLVWSLLRLRSLVPRDRLLLALLVLAVAVYLTLALDYHVVRLG